jgi:hypothetical protein
VLPDAGIAPTYEANCKCDYDTTLLPLQLTAFKFMSLFTVKAIGNYMQDNISQYKFILFHPKIRTAKLLSYWKRVKICKMFNAYRTSKLRDRCKALAAEWVMELASVNMEDAKKFIDNSTFFNDDLWFNLKYSDIQNADYAILRSLDFKINIDVEVTANGDALFVDIEPGFLGIRSTDNYNDLKISFILASTYISCVLSGKSSDAPNGFFSSQEINTDVDFLKFMLNFNKWKALKIIRKDKKEQTLEVFMTEGGEWP